DHVIANAAGCGAHMQTYGELADGTELPVRDVIAFLHDEGLGAVELAPADVERVAYHDACHALRAQGIHAQPRALLGAIPGLQVVEIPHGDRCCGAAGLYNVTEPELAERLQRDKTEAVRSTGARVIASANPGCTMQLRAGLAAIGVDARVVHPVELLDAAIEAGSERRRA
ncbi:MAG TPA: (Fe-S)-binding protein, partial [Actinomycetota bacterium]